MKLNQLEQTLVFLEQKLFSKADAGRELHAAKVSFSVVGD
jgi:hypothetical protein